MVLFVSSSYGIRCRVNLFKKENANNKLATEEKCSCIGERSLRVRVVKLWNMPQIELRPTQIEILLKELLRTEIQEGQRNVVVLFCKFQDVRKCDIHPRQTNLKQEST